MRTIHRLLLLFTFTLFAPITSAVSQTGAAHPDLSGTWKLNVAKSKIPKGGGAGSQTIYIDCMGSTILMNITADTTDQWQKFVTDGEEHVVAETEGKLLESGGDRLIHVAYWKKSSLITETFTLVVTDAGAAFPLSHFVERWTLSKNGVRLSRERDNPTQILVYDSHDHCFSRNR